MGSFINAFKADTDTDTDTDTCIPTSWTTAISRNQVDTSQRLACAWFKKVVTDSIPNNNVATIRLLNQVRTSLQLACGWFLEILFVCSMLCVFLCVHPRAFM